ncbi:type II secretion system F family protein [bacterium]|nr:type II secretion system F family protein [bacterium]
MASPQRKGAPARSKIKLNQVEYTRPNGDAKTVFLRSLSTMVLAGVTVDRSLDYLADQVDDDKLAYICRGMSERIQGGYPLSAAMNCFPRAFSRLQLRLVQMGEKTGLLDQVLLELSRYEEKERALVLKVKSTISYPAFILVVATIMMVTVPPYIMKGMFELIAGSGVEPPLITVVVMKITTFLRSPAFYASFAALAALLWFILPAWLRQHKNQRTVAIWVSKIPGLGKVYHSLALARFSRALSVQIECGMNPLGSLPISAEVTENPLLMDSIKAATERLSQGESFAASLEATEFFPKMMLNMVQAGEESASLGELLHKAAEMYEAEVDHSLDIFTAMLEPAIMAFIGIMVGTLVLATMLPMSQVIENMH